MENRRGWIVLGACLMAAPRLALAQPFVYVANADDDNVTVINAATNTVETTIDVGNEPRNPAVSPDGRRVYVPNRRDDNVTVIDGVTNTILTTIDDDPPGTFDEPYAAAVSPNGARAYIVNKGSDSLVVINTANNTVIDTTQDECFDSPEWVTTNHTGSRIYVVSKDGNRVCVVNALNNEVIDDYEVGSEPRSAVVTCDNAYIYVANNRPDLGGPDVTKIRVSDGSTTDIDFPGTGDNPFRPRNMSLTPDGRKVYVGLQPEDDPTALGIIRTATDVASTASVMNARSFYGTAVIRDGSRVYVSDEDDDQVYAFATSTDTVLTGMGLPIPAGDVPRGIATAFRCQTGVTQAPVLSWPALAVAVVVLCALGTYGILMRKRVERYETV